MSRYVDIDRLEPKQFENSEVELGVLAYDYEVVQSEPYIDIVRCKECKRANHELSGVYCGISDVLMGEDGFCSIGERSEP